MESVWDYPRPPRVEASTRSIRVVFAGVTIAETTHAFRVLETSHPPVYYIPPEDARTEYLSLNDNHSYCEFKGRADYYDLTIGDQVSRDAAWFYRAPSPRYQEIRDHIAFYSGRVDACYVDDEQVQAQESDYYGGWITSDIEGPYKGAPGTLRW
jgi:uncharacterized protein (DUF427 family)